MQEIANKIFSMTELRRKTSEVLDHLIHGPVVISENGKAHSVIVSAQEWDSIVKMLRRTEFLEDEIDVLRCELAVARGEVELEDVPAEWQAVPA